MDEKEVLKFICSFSHVEQTATKILLIPSGTFGIKRLSMVDFLRNHCGYLIRWTK